MANGLYDRGRQGFLAGDIAWDTDNIKIALIDHADDVPDLVNDEDWADRVVAAREEISGNLSSKTEADGVADAADETFSTAAGDPCESIDSYFDSGTEATSWMIFNIDTATGLPVTLNGGDVTVQWDEGADKIFKL